MRLLTAVSLVRVQQGEVQNSVNGNVYGVFVIQIYSLNKRCSFATGEVLEMKYSCCEHGDWQGASEISSHGVE